MVDESNPVISRFTNKIKELINNKADKTNATQSNAGLMSAEDKIKLDNLNNNDIIIINNKTQATNNGMYLIHNVPLSLVFRGANIGIHNDLRDNEETSLASGQNGYILFDDDTTSANILWGDETQETFRINKHTHTYEDNEEEHFVTFDKDIKQLKTSAFGLDETSYNHDVMYQSINVCPGLVSVTLPNTINTIPGRCFSYCLDLESINIPNSVTTLGYSCFMDCTGLTSINIPNSVTTLEESCFSGCTGLTSINIPNSVTTLEQFCFSGCNGLTSITMSDNLTTIGQFCFRGCYRLTSISIPNTVTDLGDRCFAGCTNLLNYELYWETNPIQYSSKNMQVNQETIFTIPQGCTQIYIDNGYPSDKLVERSA